MHGVTDPIDGIRAERAYLVSWAMRYRRVELAPFRCGVAVPVPNTLLRRSVN